MSASVPEHFGTPFADGVEVAVVVTTYNNESIIEEVVTRILNQSMDPAKFHVRVHDDASTDNTPRILRRLAVANPGRIELVLQRENQMGQGKPTIGDYFGGISTPYVTFCDGDDLWIDETKLERQKQFMEERPWCTISHHGVEISNEGGSEEYAQHLIEYLDQWQQRVERTPGSALVEGNMIMSCTAMIRTSALRPEVLRALTNQQPEDYIMFSLAAESGDIGYFPDVMSRYRLHGQNFWAERDDDLRRTAEVDCLWFMATHLRGEMQQGFRNRVLEVMWHSDDPLPSVTRLRTELADVIADRDSLRARVEQLEA